MNMMDVDRMIREWGEWEVLHSLGTTKVKKITVNPRSELSYQRHFHRSELWYVHQGAGVVLMNSNDEPIDGQNDEILLYPGKMVQIYIKTWHQLINTGKEPLIIIEIQYGDKCIEEDIERR
jgi:mannose-6-phosphate isomerase-like protein (cupin superfamily)